MNRNNLKQILSTSLSLALAMTATPWPAIAGPMEASAPSFVAKLTPPEKFGYVASSFGPQGAERPRLIVIADLHGHIDVQKNIVGLLEHFVGKLRSSELGSAQSRTPIFVEGGWEKHLEEPLHTVKDSKVRSILANYLVGKAEIPASQAYTEKHPGENAVTLTGVENKEEYLAHKQHFASTYPTRRALLEAIVRHEVSVQKLQNVVQSKAFLNLQQTREDYLKGRIAPEAYARVLARHAHAQGITGPFVRTLENAKTADQGELDAALIEIHNRVTARLATHRPLSSYVRESLGDENLIRKNLAFIDAHLDLLKRLVSNQLTPEEVPMALAKLPDLIRVAQLLLGDEKQNINIADAIHKSLDFYPYAFLRDESLASNSIAALEKDETHPATGILIAGGFHTGAVSQYLQSKNIPYLVIYPVIDRDMTAMEELNYIKRMCDDHVTPQELVADFTGHQANTLLSSGPLGAPVNGVPPTESGDTSRLLGGLGDPLQHLIGGKYSTTNPAELGTNGKAVLYKPGFVNVAQDVSALDPIAKARYDAIKALAPQAGTQIQIADMSKGFTYNYANGQFSVAGNSSVQSDFGIAVSRVLTPMLNQVAMEQSDKPSFTQAHVQSVKGTVIAEYKSNKDHQEGRDWKALNDQSILIGLNSAHPVVLFAEEVFDKLDLKSLADAFRAEDGTVKTEFDQDAQAAAAAIYDFTHEAGHLLLGKAERAVTTQTLAAAIGLAYQNATEHGLSLGLDATEIPVAFVKSFINSVRDRLPAPDLILAELGKLDSGATVTVKGLTLIISNALAPVVLADEDVKRIKDAVMQASPDTTQYEIETELASLRGSWANRVMGGIPGWRIDLMISTLIARARNRAAEIKAA